MKATHTPPRSVRVPDAQNCGVIFMVTVDVEPPSQRIDPPDCGCTDCLTGESRPAASWDEYEKGSQRN